MLGVFGQNRQIYILKSFFYLYCNYFAINKLIFIIQKEVELEEVEEI